MEEEQAHRYHASMREQGSAAASRQIQGFSNDARGLPPHPSQQQQQHYRPYRDHAGFHRPQMPNPNHSQGGHMARGHPMHRGPLAGPPYMGEPPFMHPGPRGQPQNPHPAYPHMPGRPMHGPPARHPGDFRSGQHGSMMPYGAHPHMGLPPPHQPFAAPARPPFPSQGPLPGPPRIPGAPGGPAIALIAAPPALAIAGQLHIGSAGTATPPNNAGKEAAGQDAKPEGAAIGKAEEPESEEDASTSKAWAAHKSDDGQVYYYNSATNESSWTKPAGFSGDVQDTKPTSQLRVPGTQWFEIHCEDGRKYYYNDVSEETSWTIPSEVAALKQHVKDAKANPPLAAVTAVSKARTSTPYNPPNLPYNPPPELEDVSYSEEDVAGRPVDQPEPEPELPPLPKEVPPPQPPPEHLRRRTDAELLSDFHDLLTEKGVTAFSRWEKELPKLVADKRFKAVASMKDRKAAFEDHCRNMSEQKKRVKASNGQAERLDSEVAKSNFRSLMEEASTRTSDGNEGIKEGAKPVLHTETMYRELESSYKSDPRWLALSETWREKLFDEQIEKLRAKIKEDERKSLESKVTKYRWSKSKDALSKDARYKALPRDLREKLFRDFLAQQKSEEDAKVQEKAEREKKEQSMKQELQRKLEEAGKRQKKAAHADALSNYKILLNETVKDIDARWSEWKSRLQRDPQKRASNPALDSKQAESVFRDHIEELHRKAFAGFSERMDVVLRPLLPKDTQGELPSPLRTFSKAEKLWQDEQHAQRLTSREREKLWKRFVEELVMERDDPDKLAARVRMANNKKAVEKDRNMLKDGKQERDQAYDRAYLSHDRKRLKRD